MTTLGSFFEPLILRLVRRRVCAHCDDPVKLRCRKHGTKLCDHKYCQGLHRLGSNGTHRPGLLIRDSCQLVALNTLFDHVLHSAVVITVGLFLLWIFVRAGIV